jgi:hypothetical protein
MRGIMWRRSLAAGVAAANCPELLVPARALFRECKEQTLTCDSGGHENAATRAGDLDTRLV